MTPDNGEAAPFLILVAVLAMAPVAGIPPNSEVAILAIPWPTSSLLLLCLVLAILSATTADSKDSIPPSIAITQAAGNSITMLSHVKSGKLKDGSLLGMAP